MLAAAAVLAAVSCTSPQVSSAPSATPEPVYMLDVTVSPEQTAVPATPTPRPTEIIVPKSTSDPSEAEAAFLKTDGTIRDFCLTENGYRYYLSNRDDPKLSFRIEESSPGFGTVSAGHIRSRAEEARAILENLREIDRDVLSEDNQLLFDTYEQFLESEVQRGRFVYQCDPLGYRGARLEIPLVLMSFEIDSKQDAEMYLALLEDTGRYFGELLQYETECAENGFFMTPGRLAHIYEEIDAAVSHDKKHPLETQFEGKIKKIRKISSSERRTLVLKNRELVYETYIPALLSLRDGLEDLSEYCCVEAGAKELGQDALAYYSWKLSSLSGTGMRPDELLKTLERCLDDLYLSMTSIYESDGEIDGKQLSLDAEQEKKIVSRLREITGKVYAEKGDLDMLLEEVPEAFRGLLPYLTPIRQRSGNTVILVNPDRKGADASMRLSLETYPGAVFCGKMSGKAEKAVEVMDFSAFENGASALACEAMLTRQSSLRIEEGVYSFCRMMASEYVIPSIIGIYVNYYGYTEDQIRAYLAQFDLGGMRERADEYYYSAVDFGGYGTIGTAADYAVLSGLMRDCSVVLGADFDEAAALGEIRDAGPGYADLIAEKLLEKALDSLS